ncbi:hypothetical protein [Dietzia aurantiaca]|uniref:Uncharacterized protein n=1 Tax=Dietzia aurantiaca TaxID=983873 RepID=A0ABV9PTR5_9ACTN
MTSGGSAEHSFGHSSAQSPDTAGQRHVGEVATETGARRRRSGQTIAYTVTTLAGGIGALVVLGGTVFSEDASVVDFLLWGALAALLFASAAHQWWFAGAAEDRSQRIVACTSSAEVEATAQQAVGEVDTVRRLRVAHPGLGLRDAYELMQAHKREDKQEQPRDNA